MLDWLIAKVGGWVVVAIIGGIVIAALNILAKTGRLVRSGVETRKALEKARAEMAQQGATPNEKFNALKRTAMLKIALPIVGWTVVYTLLFLAAPVSIFLTSLVLLVAPAVGYSGFKFTSE